MENVEDLITSSKRKKRKNVELGGFFDFVKTTLPTIGKVASGVLDNFLSGSRKTARYTVFENFDEERNATTGLHFLHSDNKIIAVNNTIDNSYSITLPCRGDNKGQVAHLAPLSQLDITPEISDASKANIQNLAVTEMEPEKTEGLSGSTGVSILSCLGYFTKGNLSTPFNLTAKITIRAIGLDIQISLAQGLEILKGQSLEVRSVGEGEIKRFNEVNPSLAAEEDGSTVLLLEDALAGFMDEDELCLMGDIAFRNVAGVEVADRLGEGISDEVRCAFLT
jgi:hypothetical protein